MESPTTSKITAQKLVTIYMDNSAYPRKSLVGTCPDRHATVEEHLAPQLADGWRVISIHGFGGTSQSLVAQGWLAVLLERG
jgi:hypothetical protein